MWSQSKNINSPSSTINAFRSQLWRALHLAGIWWLIGWIFKSHLANLALPVRLVILFIGKLCFKVVWIIIEMVQTSGWKRHTNLKLTHKSHPSVSEGTLSAVGLTGLLFIFLMTTHNFMSFSSLYTFTSRISESFLSLLSCITFALFFCVSYFFFFNSWALALNSFSSSVLDKLFPESKLCFNA